MLQDLLNFKQNDFSVTFMDLSKLTLHDTASNLADHFLVCMVDQIQSKKLKEHIQSDIGNIARELRFLDYEQQVIKPLILS